MSTGEIVAVGTGALLLGGAVLFVMHRQNEAALQAAAASQAAAARAAAGAKNSDFDIGAALVNLGGAALDKALGYVLGGPAGANAQVAKAAALQV